ncbi:unnamed protein product [Rotaria sp. Silwood1]|nr:unnamed protein product [Rotaria sp. Silwood1]
MLDANLPMKYAFVVVPIIQQSTKDLLSLPKTKDKLALTTYFVFIFEIILNDILTMHASGKFDMNILLNKLYILAKQIAR